MGSNTSVGYFSFFWHFLPKKYQKTFFSTMKINSVLRLFWADFGRSCFFQNHWYRFSKINNFFASISVELNWWLGQVGLQSGLQNHFQTCFCYMYVFYLFRLVLLWEILLCTFGTRSWCWFLSQYACEACGLELQKKRTFPDPQGNWWAVNKTQYFIFLLIFMLLIRIIYGSP